MAELKAILQVSGPRGEKGADGAKGADGEPGKGIKAGGAVGQVLTKVSATDYDTGWVDVSGTSVTSVNGKTGTVVLTTSDLNNDSGYITNSVADLSHYDTSTVVNTKIENGVTVTDVQLNNTSILNNKVAKITTVDNLTSAGNLNPLTANQGKLLNDRITNLEGIGRFLAIWNSATGLPYSEPPSLPYLYKTGDYYRVGNVSSTTNYKPYGAQYTGAASQAVETDDVSLTSVYYYDGYDWKLQQSGGGSGTITDVQVNGTSVVSGSVANVPQATNSSLGVVKPDGSTITVSNSGALTSVEPAGIVKVSAQTFSNEQQAQARANINAQATLSSGVNIKTINNNSVLGTGNISIEALSDVTVNGTSVVSNNVAVIPDGSVLQKGVLKVGDGLGVTSGTVSADVQDIQINSSSIVSNHVANIPVSSTSAYGVIKIGPRVSGQTYANGVFTYVTES